jgi:hypothetical protein
MPHEDTNTHTLDIDLMKKTQMNNESSADDYFCGDADIFESNDADIFESDKAEDETEAAGARQLIKGIHDALGKEEDVGAPT